MTIIRKILKKLMKYSKESMIMRNRKKLKMKNEECNQLKRSKDSKTCYKQGDKNLESLMKESQLLITHNKEQIYQQLNLPRH
jgi:hypothetical protein